MLIDGLHEDLNRVTKKPTYTYNPDKEESLLSAIGVANLSWKRYHSNMSSLVSDVFAGQLESIIKCKVCGFESPTFDIFFDLSLPIPKGGITQTLFDCINEFGKIETLDTEWTCIKCKSKGKATKQVLISHLPKVLVIRISN